MKHLSSFQSLNLAIEYYRISSKSILSDMDLECLEYMLILSESNCTLDYLITEIDIFLAENKDSGKILEEHYKQIRENIRRSMANEDEFISLPR